MVFLEVHPPATTRSGCYTLGWICSRRVAEASDLTQLAVANDVWITLGQSEPFGDQHSSAS